MIEIRKVQTTDGHRINHFVESEEEERIIEAENLMLFPALIDPHVHFRVPGEEYKESWESAAKAALAGGVTTVFDMPNNRPSCTTAVRLEEKRRLIEEQLKKVKIPLRYALYLGADPHHLQEISKIKGKAIGLKIYMGASTGDLLMGDRKNLEEAFRLSAAHDLLVAVHAEDQGVMEQNRKKYEGQKDPSLHSKIRSREAAERAVGLAIELAQKTGANLYIAHVSCREELSLIRQAKKEGLPVFAEATPHHLFLDEEAYRELGTFALVNPPLRTRQDREALWEALHDETIDVIGSDHAPHSVEEKKAPFGIAPSGCPSIELYFPLLLNAYHERKLSLEQIVSLTHTRPQEIFDLPLNDDIVLVDLHRKKKVEDGSLKTKAKWSPYRGRTLTGWPRYTLLGNRLFDVEKL